MFADEYTIHERRHRYKFDMRELKKALKDHGIGNGVETDDLSEAITNLMRDAISKGYEEGRMSDSWDD